MAYLCEIVASCDFAGNYQLKECGMTLQIFHVIFIIFEPKVEEFTDPVNFKNAIIIVSEAIHKKGETVRSRKLFSAFLRKYFVQL